MSLKQRINDEMKAALLGGDRFVGETLRNLKAAILNEEVAKSKRDEGLTDMPRALADRLMPEAVR